jgi:prepilin-type N-terminal cleavage/methylation domain-containing protein
VRRRDAGLTLIEILVATAILAVFFAAVYSIVSGTIAIRDQVDEMATPYAVGPAVMDRIAEDLRSTLVEPYKDLDAFKAETENVNGESCTKLDFVTCVPSRARVKTENDKWVKARVNEIGYRVRRSETSDRLLALYRREDLAVDDTPLEGGVYYKLADRVKTFKIDWFVDGDGDPASGDDAKGEEEWDAKKEKKLPWGCRVSLVLVGETPLDEEGRPVDEIPEYAFSTYVVFPTRHDKKPTQN